MSELETDPIAAHAKAFDPTSINMVGVLLLTIVVLMGFFAQ